MSEDFRSRRQDFKQDILKNKEAFLGQGNKNMLVKMRYFRGLCGGEIDWCKMRTKKINHQLNMARSGIKDTKYTKKLNGDLLMMAEIARIRRRQSVQVRELIEKKDFQGFLAFLEKLE